jgi:hypothetical protein
VLRARILLAPLALMGFVTLSLPMHADAGGTQVFTPPGITPESCPRGAAPQWNGGYDPEAVVIECLPLGDSAVQFSVHYWQKRGRHRLCHYAAAAGRSDIDGVCGPVDLLSRAGLSADIMRAELFRKPGGPVYVSGIVSRFVRRVVVSYRDEEGQQQSTGDDVTAIGREVKHFVRPRQRFSFFVTELPADAQTCAGVLVSAEGYPGFLRDAVELGHNAFHFSGSRVRLPEERTCDQPEPTDEPQWVPGLTAGLPGRGGKLFSLLLRGVRAFGGLLGVLERDFGASPAPESAAGASVAELRAALIEGTRRDLRHAANSPQGFARCLIGRFRSALTDERLSLLAAILSDRGSPLAAQALGQSAVSPADLCGGRRYMPELTNAALGLGHSLGCTKTNCHTGIVREDSTSR